MMNKLLVAVSCTILAGCTLRPSYKTPELDLPSCKQDCDCFSDFLNKRDWWTIFNDNELNNLEILALKNNHDMAIAVKNVEVAMNTLYTINADLFPIAMASLNSSQYFASEEGKNATPSLNKRNISDSIFALNVSYELDLFGKKRNMSIARYNELLATNEAKKTVFLSLTSAVAKAYFALLSIDARLTIAERTLKTRRTTYDKFICRLKNGFCKELDVRRVESEMLSIKAKVFALKSAQKSAEMALGLLIGESPKGIVGRNIKRGNILNIKLLDNVLSSVSSDVLLKRPDIVAAECQLKAANANIGVARAAFFPSISLTSAVGNESNDLSMLFRSPATDIWSIGFSATLPIFNAGKLAINEKIARIHFDKAVENYKKVVKTAFRETYDALNMNNNNRLIVTAIKRQEKAAERGYYLAKKQEQEGLIGLLDLLDVERNLLAVRMEYVSAIENALNSAVDLCKSMGGGINAK